MEMEEDGIDPVNDEDDNGITDVDNISVSYDKPLTVIQGMGTGTLEN